MLVSANLLYDESQTDPLILTRHTLTRMLEHMDGCPMKKRAYYLITKSKCGFMYNKVNVFSVCTHIFCTIKSVSAAS